MNASPWLRYGGALAIVLMSAGLAELLFRMTHDTRLSMVFLAGVLVAAVLLGAGPGYLAAAAAFLIYNFDLADPRFTLSMGSTEDFVTLLGFLAAATLTGGLTTRIRSDAAQARARADATDVLFAVTQEFSAASDEEHIRERLAYHLAAAAGGQAIVRHGLRMHADPADAAIPRDIIVELTALARQGAREHQPAPLAGWTFRVLQVEGRAVGVAAWRPEAREPLRPEQQTLLEILADAGAAAIARARLAAGKAEAETRARTEDLRNALLSSISHDMRTPLAAIMVSAGSLRRYGAALTPDTQTDLATTIEEEAARLDAFVANLLNMTRLEAGALVAQRIGFSIPEVVERTLARRQAATQRVTFQATPGLQEGVGDPLLFEQALGNVVENALRYSGAGGPVAVSARAEPRQVVVEVVDQGAGVPGEDLGRIFEKFFRAPGTAQLQGAGLGLSIARGLLESMDGSIEAHNRNDGATGLVVSIRLPVAA